jgi:predicted porin
VKSKDWENNPSKKPELNLKGRRNMKKTLLVSAIAAATFSGSALAMTAEELQAQMDTMPTVYGNIQYRYTYTDTDENGAKSNESGLNDNGSTIGVYHDHEIAPGVEAFFRMELEGIDATNKADDSGLNGLDEAYIGVRGDSFGQVWVGSDDSIYESQLGGYSNWIYEVALLNIPGTQTTGEGDLIQYMSPSFGGLTLMGAVQINGDDDSDRDNDKSYPYQLAATYSMDALTVSVVMDSNDGDSGDNSTEVANPSRQSNENSYGIAVEYAIDALVLDVYYENRGAKSGVADPTTLDNYEGAYGRKQLGLMATYNLGVNTFRASYEMAETDVGDLESDVITLQALHNVSDNLYVYTELLQRNDELGSLDRERNQANVGAVYYF